MKFYIWYGLDINKDLDEQTSYIHNAIISSNISIISSNIDDELTLTIEVIIHNLDELLELGYIFSDDICICGADNNIIMPKGTMRELGL